MPVHRNYAMVTILYSVNGKTARRGRRRQVVSSHDNHASASQLRHGDDTLFREREDCTIVNEHTTC
jgi:riboflavin biosynthesis pyrimidine reductase